MAYTPQDENFARKRVNLTQKKDTNENNEDKAGDNPINVRDLVSERLAAAQINMEDKDLSFLNKDEKYQFEIEEKAPKAIPLVEGDARIKIINIIKSLNFLSPIIKKAMSISSDEDIDQVNEFNRIVKRSREISVAITEIIELETNNKNNAWVLRAFDEIAMNIAVMDMNSDIKTIKNFYKSVLESIDRLSVETNEIKNVVLPSDIRINLSLMKAMNYVIAEQQKFDFYRNKDLDMLELSGLLFDRAAEAVIELVDPLTTEEDRILIFEIFVIEAGKALANCWQIESEKLQKELSLKNKHELNILFQARPEGFSLDIVLERFEQQMRRLKVLSKQVKVPSKKRY